MSPHIAPWPRQVLQGRLGQQTERPQLPKGHMALGGAQRAEDFAGSSAGSMARASPQALDFDPQLGLFKVIFGHLRHGKSTGNGVYPLVN